MKQLIKSLILLASLWIAGANTALGQANALTFTFDEFGTGIFVTNPVPSVIGPDPSGGLSGPVLIYFLPIATVTGDVVLSEPGQPAAGPSSDIIRFWDPTGGPQTQ